MNKDELIGIQVQRVLLIAVIFLLAYGAYLVLSPFLVPLAWGAILVYVSWPLYRRLRQLLRGRDSTSALLMTLLLMAAVILPVYGVASLLVEELGVAFQVITARLASIPPTVPEAIVRLPLVGDWAQELIGTLAGDPAQLRAELARRVQQFSGALAGLAGGLGRNLVGLGLTLLIAFFFYRDGERLIEQTRRLLWRLLGDRAEAYMKAVGNTVTAVMVGLLLTALVQGILAGAGYWAVDLKAPILLGAVTMVFALIPFGTPLVWGTLGLWLIITERVWPGIGLLIWGALVVSSIDNLIRPLVISSATHVHFLLVLLGVLGGALAFGFVGLILGPVILAMATALWHEWLAESAPRQS
jgi:predicted PurR-regulated permease PerM